MEKIKLLINIILFTAFASSFIGVFFFTYAKNIEKEIVLKNINYTLNELTDDIIYMLPANIKTLFASILDKITLPDMHDIDMEVINNNTKLIKLATGALSSYLLFAIIITVILASKYNYDLVDIFMENIVLVFFIGTVEFLFLKNIASNYISANPNKIKLEFIKSIKK